MNRASPSRRRTTTRRSRLDRRALWAAGSIGLLPVAAGVLIVAGALVGPPDPPSSAPREVEVAETSHACPTAGGLSAATGQVVAGDETIISELTPDGPVDSAGDPSAWVTAVPEAEATLVRQTGLAEGGVGFVAGVAPDDDGGGLVVGACPGVSDEAWFVGLGSGGRHQSTLVLTNLSDVPAVADVTLWGADGPVDAVDNTGILLEPGTTRRLRLEELAAGGGELAVRVTRQRGALSVAAIDTFTTAFSGTEAVPAAPAPATEHVLTGLVGGLTQRTLLLANPGETAARATVEVAGPEGRFVPEGLDDIAIPAASVVALDVPEAAGAEASAFRVTADQPVVPSVRLLTGQDDLAYAVSDQPWQGPVVVPVAFDTLDVRPVMQLIALDDPATVDLAAFDAAMNSVGTASIDVGADSPAVIDLASPDLFDAPDIAYVVATSSDPVTGVAIYREGERIAVLSLSSAPVSALGPVVRPDF